MPVSRTRFNTKSLPLLSAAVVMSTALFGTSVANAQTNTSWEANFNVFWQSPLNWSGFQIPTFNHNVSINPYAGPSPALIFIPSDMGPAFARQIRCEDWNCPPFGCDFSASINGISVNGNRASLRVEEYLLIVADFGSDLGDGESNLSLSTLDVAASLVKVEELNGADSTLELFDTRVTIRSDGAGVYLQPGTEMTLAGNSTVRHENSGGTYEFVIGPTAFLSTENGTDIQDASLSLLGTMVCNGTTTIDAITALGTTFLNSTLTIDGPTDSLLSGSIIGPGSLVWNGSGALTMTAAPKGFTGNFDINNGVAAFSGENQLGLGNVRFNGGTLRPASLPMTIDQRPFVMRTNGGTFDVVDGTFVINTGISGSGAMTKNGNGLLEVTAASSFTGGTFIDAGSIEVNNSSGSGLGSGPVHVASGATLSGRGGVSGAVNIADGGTLAPGTLAPVVVSTLNTGDTTFESGSTLAVRLAGLSPSSFDQVSTQGTVVIESGATLDISVNGFSPAPGDAFLVIASPNLTGMFDTVVGPGPGTWCTDITNDGLVLRYDDLCGVDPCPSDVNGDGAVSSDDLLALLANWGACDQPCDGDVDGDLDVDVDDLITLLSAWGPCE